MGEMSETVRAPKLRVKTVRSAKFNGQLRPCRLSRNLWPNEGNRSRSDALTDISRHASANQGFSKDEALRVGPAPIGRGHLFDLRFVHLCQLVKKRFGLRLVRAERIQRHPPV